MVRAGIWMDDLYALDFDGVVCDSCTEASIAGLEAAKRRWPEVFRHMDAQAEDWILQHMHNVRPVVETGDDFLLLARLLLELYLDQQQGQSSVSRGITEDAVLEDWHSLKPALLQEWGETDKQELENLLGIARDRWIARDPDAWLKANRLYPGIPDCLKFASSKIFIVTTKETRFVQLSLKELAGVDFPTEQIYGLGSGPKVEVLVQLQSRPEHRGMALHFVEDRFGTLLNVMKKPELEKWNLYLASWGYNTPKEREAGQQSMDHRIRVLDLPDFCSKLK